MAKRRGRKYGKRRRANPEHTIDLVNRESYMKAKEYKGFKRKDVNNWPGYVKILNTIYRNVGDAIVENEEGVYIERLGYFGCMIYQKNSYDTLSFDSDRQLTPLINSHTNGAVFTLNFTPVSRYVGMRTLLMDGTFSHPIVRRFSKKLQEGKFYKNNLALFLK